MKKVFDQTVRDLKREVNKKVLKVPGIEQKVLDATSNEPWGPHGTLLADIAQATRNYHEYQMIMAVIWKRINDTGKNWRHVYKALTVLEYLVAHGSERVIDDIREHAYQISTLSDFQYIDSSGKDQGNNVRRKSQSLVALVNDKERISEVREKAAANRDKFRNPSAGGMYRPGGYGDKYDYDRYEGRYGNRDDDNGYGREREYGYKDDDRYGRNGDSYGRDGDRYGRDYEDRYGRDGYRDDDYRGRSRSVDRYQDGSSRSSDRNRDDDGQSSNRRLERKFSEQNIGGPPSYEEALSESRSPARSDRDGENSAASVPKSSSPPAPATSSPPAASGAFSPPVHLAASSPTAAPSSSSPPASHSPTQGTNSFNNSTSGNEEVLASDEFDPRNSFSAAPTVSSIPAPTTSNSAEMDLLGSLSDSFSSNALAIVPAMPATASTEADAHANTGSVPTFAATQSPSNMMNQSFDDPFGDSPFRAIPSTDSATVQQPISASTASFQPNQNAEMPQPAAPNMESVPNFGDPLYGTYSSTSDSNSQPPSANSQFLPQELSMSQPETDILADILPPSGPSPSVASQVTFSAPAGQPAHPTANMYGNQPAQPSANMYGNQPAQPTANMYGNQPAQPTANMYGNQPAQPTANMYGSFHQQPGLTGQVAPNIAPQTPSGSVAQLSSGTFALQGTSTAPVASYMAPQTPAGPAAQFNRGNFLPHQSSAVPSTPQIPQQTPPNPLAQQNSNLLNNLLPQAGQSPAIASQPSLSSSTGALALVPQSQPSKEKFELKSAVWADTLSRGLVNLNISGPKTNPTADIGIDFDAINRKEKRMEKKPPQSQVTSTVTMGRAMGSGSGLGRTGVSAIRPPSNPMMGSGMGMGMASGPGMGMGMGMGGGQGIGMGMGGGRGIGMGLGMGSGQGMGMGMGMGGGSGMGMGSYGGMNQPMGMGMGMGMNNGMNMGVGMNMGMGQGGQMQPQTGMPPGTTMPGGYRPMTGTGGYTQQPYGGGYR